MIYRFKSKATGDLIMMGSVAEEILRAIGKTPAPRGLIDRTDLSSAILALERAIHADASSRTGKAHDGVPSGEADEDVSLGRHAWPLLDMLRRSQQEGADIVWES